MPEELTRSSYIGAIRCECGSEMEVLETESRASPEGIQYTVECLGCGEKGGYNSGTLDVYGAVDRLDIVGE